MALLIGDIGGSSSRWAVLDRDRQEVAAQALPGFNPSTGDPAALQHALAKLAIGTKGDGKPLEVVAYGAGCGHRQRAQRMREALEAVWPHALVQVETDLLGAARSLYGAERGLALILGTGMNTGYYDGHQLYTPLPSLGFILGDEGSGADIGKHLLRDALYDLVPEALRNALFPQGADLPCILREVHGPTGAQAYVASFTAALQNHLHEQYVHDLLASRFFALSRLIAGFFSAAERAEVRAVGSVAHGFRNLLEVAMDHRGMKLTAVAKDPMPGLIRYHALQAPH